MSQTFFVVLPRTGKADVENEIRRGAFYMRPRKFILPQAGTGGYGIRPYVFCRGGEGRVFPCYVCRGDHWSPVNLPPQRIFRDSFLVRQVGTGEQCSPLQMFFDSLSPKYSCPPHVSLPHRLRAEPPRRGGKGMSTPFSTRRASLVKGRSFGVGAGHARPAALRQAHRSRAAAQGRGPRHKKAGAPPA